MGVAVLLVVDGLELCCIIDVSEYMSGSSTAQKKKRL